jgi:glycyl-tRNA synthetase alpha chain
VNRAWEHLKLYEAECQALLDQYNAAKGGKSDSSEERMAKSEKREAGEERVSNEEHDAERRRFPVLAAFDLCLKCSHLFNILDARGAISVTERVGVIARIRALAVGVAKAYVDQQQAEQDSKKEEAVVTKTLQPAIAKS